MKKKIILFSLIASLIIGMTACNNENSVPEVTEQITSISETVTEKKTKTTSQSETSTEKTETAETIDQSETSLTVNNETQITVKEENTTEIVTDEASEALKNENKSEEFSFDNLIITIAGTKYNLPIYVEDLKSQGWNIEQPELSNEKNENGNYTLFGLFYNTESEKDSCIHIIVESKDKIISNDDKITMMAIYISDNWSVGKIYKGMARDEINNLYNNFTLEKGNDYYINKSQNLVIAYDKSGKCNAIVIKGI